MTDRLDFVCVNCKARRATHDALDRHGREQRHSVHALGGSVAVAGDLDVEVVWRMQPWRNRRW